MLETLSPESRPLGGSGILVSPIAWAMWRPMSMTFPARAS